MVCMGKYVVWRVCVESLQGEEATIELKSIAFELVIETRFDFKNGAMIKEQM